MRITSSSNVTFGRSLTQAEEKRFDKVLHDAQRALGIENGKSVLLVHEPCLPQSIENNTGASTLSSDEALDFFDFMKRYAGINSVEVMPSGEYSNLSRFNLNINPNPYSSGTFGLGEQTINLELFKDLGIIDDEDIKYVVSKNGLVDLANIDNVAGENSAQRDVLKRAWKRFLNLDSNHPVKEEFRNYRKENGFFLNQKELFEALTKENGTRDWQKWDDIDKNLLQSEDEASLKRISYIKDKHRSEMDFYSFRQFLADISLKKAKTSLNSRGLDLIGDCPINFSNDEVWANQKAFIPNQELGWGVPSVDYKKLYKSDGSLGEAGKLLQEKFEYYLKRYDGIRFDAGWAYSTNRSIHKENGNTIFEDLGDSIFKLIEKTAKKIKGEGYDLSKLMYEVEADDGLGAIDWTSGNPIERSAFKGRTKIYTTSYMHSGWGSSEFLKNGVKMNSDEVILGVGNHDSIPLSRLAQDINSQRAKDQIDVLSSIFKAPKEFLSNPVNFIKAKNAEILGVKNRMYFFMDIFGRDEVFNNLIEENKTANDFRYKIPTDYKTAYHKSLQEGSGLNIMESLRLAFMREGLDKTKPELFEEISKFSKILYKKSSKINKALVLTGALWVCFAAYISSRLISRRNAKTSDFQNLNITLNDSEKNIFQKLL